MVLKQKTRVARGTADIWPREIAKNSAAAPQKKHRWGRAVAVSAAGLLMIALLVPLGTGLYFIFRGETLALAGYRFLMVPTDELQPAINKNALILVEEIPAYDVTVGSYVSFRVGGEEAVQRVKEIVDNGKSLVFYLTLPSSGAPVIMVPGSEITGVVTLQYNNLGAAIAFVTSPLGTAAVLGVPVILLIVLQLISAAGKRRRKKHALPAPPAEAFRYDDDGRAALAPAYYEIEAPVSAPAAAATPKEPPQTGDAHPAPAAPEFQREELDFTAPGSAGGKTRKDAFDDLLKDFDDL